ncbi:hypothetical protein Hanom_Chr00s090382g01798641 [Helianthus anomalus]
MAGEFGRIGLDDIYIDPKDYYGDDEHSKFSLKVCHNGEFTKSPGLSYVGGKFNFIDCVDIDDFGMVVLEEMVKQLGYYVDMVSYFHYKISYVCLDLGLKSMSSNCDFSSLYEHMHGGVKLIKIYVEHWTCRVLMTSCGEEVMTQSPHAPPPESQEAEVHDATFVDLFQSDYNDTEHVDEDEQGVLIRQTRTMRKTMMREMMIRILMKTGSKNWM